MQLLTNFDRVNSRYWSNRRSVYQSFLSTSKPHWPNYVRKKSYLDKNELWNPSQNYCRSGPLNKMELQRLSRPQTNTTRTVIIVSQIKEIVRAQSQKALRCKYFKANIYNNGEHTFLKGPQQTSTFKLWDYETRILVFDVRPGFVETTVIPSTQSQC